MLGDLVVNLAAKTGRFVRDMNLAQRSINAFSSATRFAMKAVAGAIAGAAASIGGIAALSVRLAANAEQTAISFEVLTGSVLTANKLIRDLRTMGAGTPFEFGDLAGATKLLLNFGRSSSQVMEDLDMLSNVAAGDAQKLNSLALVFGQVAANARLTGGDLLQFINTGFNPLQQIAERTGESMVQLRDRMSKGQIGFEEIREAFRAATSEGGRFYQMNEKQSKTLLGRWSTLKDGVTSALIEIGQSIMENMDLTGVIEQITKSAESFKKDLIPAIEEFIKMAPDMVEALGKIAKGLSAVADATLKGVENLQKWSFLTASILSGNTPEETAKAYIEHFGLQPKTGGGGRAGAVEILPAEGDIKDLMRHAFPKSIEAIEKKKTQSEQMGGMMAEKVIAGLVRDGIEALQTGVMSLGGPRESQMTHQARTLEQGSSEAFEVMRANVGGPEKDLQKKQVDIAQKSHKTLEDIKKALMKKAKETVFKVAGID